MKLSIFKQSNTLCSVRSDTLRGDQFACALLLQRCTSEFDFADSDPSHDHMVFRLETLRLNEFVNNGLCQSVFACSKLQNDNAIWPPLERLNALTVINSSNDILQGLNSTSSSIFPSPQKSSIINSRDFSLKTTKVRILICLTSPKQRAWNSFTSGS